MQTLSQSPTDPGFVAAPWGFYDAVRAAGGLVRWRDYDLPVIATHAGVGAALRDPRLGRATPPGARMPIPDHLRRFWAVEARSLLELEGPDHTRLRGLVLRAFTTRRIAGLEAQIAALCHRLIDAFPAGMVDLLPAYATPVPVIVIARLLGVPDAAAPDLLGWSRAMTAMYRAGRTRADEDAADKAAAAFAAFLRDHIVAKRQRPGDDLLSQLIAARDADDTALREDEMIATAILLLNAGHEATVHALGNAIAALLQTGQRPDDPAAAVEEALRYDPPLHLFTRWVYAPCTLLGHDFVPGDRVGLLLAAAGRDPATYRAPDRYDPARYANGAPKPHAAFGAGPHFCLGASLARMEMRIALQVLWDRCPRLTLTAPPQVADLYHFRGRTALHVAF